MGLTSPPVYQSGVEIDVSIALGHESVALALWLLCFLLRCMFLVVLCLCTSAFHFEVVHPSMHFSLSHGASYVLC